MKMYRVKTPMISATAWYQTGRTNSVPTLYRGDMVSFAVTQAEIEHLMSMDMLEAVEFAEDGAGDS